MVKLINITETPDAITAEAVSLVWEQYEAPRKRLPRARIIEHRFTVSIPKVSEDAAPLAFVVEHFPTMTLDNKEYRAGYDQPIRWYSGKFYTPARMRNRLRYLNWRNANEYDSADPVTYMIAHVKSLPSETERERERHAEAIARDAIRADSHAGYTADSVAREVRHMTYGKIIISGEICALRYSGRRKRLLRGKDLRKRCDPSGELRKDHRPGAGPHREKTLTPFFPRQHDPVCWQLRLQPALSFLPES